MQPLRDILLVQIEKPDETTKSGLFIQRKWEQAKSEATVLAVGTDVTVAKAGDKVHINPYAIIDAGQEAQFIREKDVLAHVAK